MARHLRHAGHDMVVYNRTRQRPMRGSPVTADARQAARQKPQRMQMPSSLALAMMMIWPLLPYRATGRSAP
jgi:hypothetical protein